MTMIVHSTPSRLHFSSSLICCENGSIGTDYNYNKSATIPTSASSSSSNLKSMASTIAKPLPNQQTPTRRSTMVAGRPSRRALAKREHQKSLRYTRTLEIIPEDDSGSSEFSMSKEKQLNDSSTTIVSGSSSKHEPAVIPTDFWHSQRSMKKSATNVSLGSLLAEGNQYEDTDCDDRNPRKNLNSNAFPMSSGYFVEHDYDDDYDNFLEDWDM